MQLRDRDQGPRFRPLPVRERMIPKGTGNSEAWVFPPSRTGWSRLLETGAGAHFRGGFLPCSYGFRPNRRAQDAIAEIHHFDVPQVIIGSWSDIKACFDEISHSALLGRVRATSQGQTRLALVKAFLKAGDPR